MSPSALLAISGDLSVSVQTHCDFSGSTDMAIGLALMLGVHLPINFLRPYRADSVVDFWRRWHITLSYWLRDYLYIPLGGSRHGRLQETRNVIITMALGGLWHGATGPS
jgi:alginate O-acetyltransferase complex protein AlgI